MTSEEIQIIEHKLSENAEVESFEKLKLITLYEIAFQLAKLNEHFAEVDAAVFGGPIEKKKEKGT